LSLASRLWSALRDARYALPGQVGRVLPAPDAARLGARLARDGLGVTYGYFQADDAAPEAIVAAYAALKPGPGTYLSVKAPPLGFDPARIAAIAGAGVPIMFDAHAPAQAGATLALVEAFPGSGCVIPARWRRSLGDAERLRDSAALIRVVKGEWADPDGDPADADAAYRAVIGRLAGRRAPVAVATHDPALAERALQVLLASGTPCELELLRGLPRRRCVAVARRLGVPVRIYVPFGPGWWPYAVDKALARPYLARWWLRDWLGR